ncbi:MAG: PP2C family protein-serine/threonine phosphatase [Bdellovibrionales bacterium]
MRNFKVRLSLRYKLLFLLTSLPIASLAVYLFMATDLFQKDKVAYVFDSSATVSRSLATQMRIELQSAYASLRTVVEHYDFATKQFSPVAQDLFTHNPKAHALLLFRHQADGNYEQLGVLSNQTATSAKFIADAKQIADLRARAVKNTASVSESGLGAGMVSLSFRLGEKDAADHMIIMALYQADDMVNAFDGTGIYSSMVLTRSGTLSLGAAEVGNADLEQLRGILKSKANEGTAEAKLNDGQNYLISYASVGLGELTVVSKVDKAKALKAVEVLISKSLLFFLALIALTLVISVIASGQLTSTLSELFEGTKQIAQGDFSVRVQSRSNDEIGGLAESFNWMAAEVSRLMSATAEKARMESELATVRTVQETLFPPSSAKFGPLRITGHFEPASECGGDWWSYSLVGTKVYIWIGDATGHGAPAALITSAARSAAAVIDILPEMTPGRALSIMNHAIHQTSKGQIMMTFFMASIDLYEGTFTYASASHDPPYLMRRTGEKLAKKDLVPLNEVNGPRLGDQVGFEYQDITVPFAPGDMVFLYTDGILDIEDAKGKKWGERVFLKTVLEAANNGGSVESKIENLNRVMNGFREGTNLIDDVTMVMVEFEQAAKAAA